MQTIPIDIISNSHTIPMTPEQIRVVEAVSPSVALKRVSEGLVVTVHDIHGEKSETVYDGVKGDPGPSPTAKVVKTENGAVITVTDAEGTTTAEISNGREGDPGQSPTVKIVETENGAVITVTDVEGTTTAQISNGAPGSPGNDGVSPTISVTDITGGHRVTITDATGAHSFDVMDGEDGQGAVQDVQVAGVSVLSDGVANVPVASNNELGAVKIKSQNGININASNELTVNPANLSIIKAGTATTYPITTSHQHESAFYGLAKAAGDTTQRASKNAVGNYTESAKSAISEMLNGSVSVSGTAPTINALPGIRYICGEVTTIDITTPASGIIDVVFTSGSTPAVLTVTPPSGMTMRWANGFDPTTLEADTTYEINIADGCLGVAGTWS